MIDKPYKIIYFTNRFPTLSQTFIQREIEAVVEQGFELHIFPLLRWGKKYQWHEKVTVHPIEWQEIPLFFFRWLRNMWKLRSTVKQAFSDIIKKRPFSIENTFINLWAIDCALARAHQMDADHYHGVWATGPATAAWIAALLHKKQFSFGAHAFDIYRYGGDALLPEKMRDATFIHTTTMTNIGYLTTKNPEAKDKIVLSRRGLHELPSLDEVHWENRKALKILSVARLVPKKGIIYQIEAAKVLKAKGVHFELNIIGDGPLRKELQKEIDAADLRREVRLLGSMPQAEVNRYYKYSSIFWHTGIIDPEGDRDGLPNVIPEAMSYALPVISCPDPGAREAVTTRENGIVIDVTNADLLAETVLRLHHDHEFAKELGLNGRKWVEQFFLSEKNATILVNKFIETIESQKSRF
jgi:glycosyltransferase involved in cell wall biosynthesis